MMIVRSISEPPVRGSLVSGYSWMVSTTSPARSPQAMMITTSTVALRAIRLCSTVLPAPKGPGMQPVPPRATGKKASMIRWVGGDRLGGIEPLQQRLASIVCGTGLRTGQLCAMKTSRSEPSARWTRAIGSVTVCLPLASQVTSSSPVSSKGTMILWVRIPSSTVPRTCPANTFRPTSATGSKDHLRLSSSAATSTPRGRKKPYSSASSWSGFCRPSKTRPSMPGPRVADSMLAAHLDVVADLDPLGVLEDLHVGDAALDAQHLGLEPLVADPDVADFVLLQLPRSWRRR